MGYNRYNSQYKSDAAASDESCDDAIKRRRIQQLNDEIKIEQPNDSNYYSDKALRKAHRHRSRRYGT